MSDAAFVSVTYTKDQTAENPGDPGNYDMAVVDLPATVNAGDNLIIFFDRQTGGLQPTLPSGWSKSGDTAWYMDVPGGLGGTTATFYFPEASGSPAYFFAACVRWTFDDWDGGNLVVDTGGDPGGLAEGIPLPDECIAVDGIVTQNPKYGALFAVFCGAFTDAEGVPGFFEIYPGPFGTPTMVDTEVFDTDGGGGGRVMRIGYNLNYTYDDNFGQALSGIADTWTGTTAKSFRIQSLLAESNTFLGDCGEQPPEEEETPPSGGLDLRLRRAKVDALPYQLHTRMLGE